LARNGNAQGRQQKLGYAQMLRDVFVASINRGQFLLAVVGGLAALVIVKMPGEDVSRLVFRLVESIESGKILGYVLAMVLAIGWFWHARWQRRMITEEMHRIGQQRTEAQSKAGLAKKLKSSEKRT
jgi:hypothetical protein